MSETNCRDSLNLERQYTFSGIAIRSTGELPYERLVQPWIGPRSWSCILTIDVVDIAIIGAGPYGLSLAAHLRDSRRSVRIFG